MHGLKTMDKLHKQATEARRIANAADTSGKQAKKADTNLAKATTSAATQPK